MACLKCGKKTKDEQTFCARCLDIMENYPIDPNVHVQLPHRAARADGKKSARKRRILSAEEQVAVLRRRSRVLTALVVVLVMLLGAAVFLLLRSDFTETELEIGKNYTFGNPFE